MLTRNKGPDVPEGEGVPDVEEEEPPKAEDDIVNEQIFTFNQFEQVQCRATFPGDGRTYVVPQKFAHSEVTRTLLAYLARYQDFTSPEQMKRVVGLMHRQAVKQKAEGLFFMVLLPCS